MTDHPALIRLRDLAHALPGTEERPSHGQPTFFVEGRMFAQFRHDHHGDGRTIVAVRTSAADEATTLIEAAPNTYSRVAYFKAEWVGLDLADPDWQLVEDRVSQSWELAAPKALLEAGGR